MSDETKHPRKGGKKKAPRKVVPFPGTEAPPSEGGPKKRRRPMSRTSPVVLESEGRIREAVTLRLKGESYEAIAQALGYKDESGARKAVGAALERTRQVTAESVEELRQIELDRIDLAIRGLRPSVEAGDPNAIKVWLQASQSRRALLGLDAPKRTELSGPGGAPLQVETRTGPDFRDWTTAEVEAWERLTSEAGDLLRRVEERQKAAKAEAGQPG